MSTLNRGYAWKAFGLLLFIGAVATALFLGPVLRTPPELVPDIDVPAMTNIPPGGSLQIETE
jgi:hypothetical protein